MCGIYCHIHRNKADNPDNPLKQWDSCKENVERRGPDLQSEHSEKQQDWSIDFRGSVLWMQGDRGMEQPAVDQLGNVLLWNGDIFHAPFLQDGKCDTLGLLETLAASGSVLETLSLIQGPYSFVYFKKKENLIYFGRDPIGRHSLLMDFNPTEVTLTSVADKQMQIKQLPAVGVFIVNLNHSELSLTCCPFYKPNEYFYSALDVLQCPVKVDEDTNLTAVLDDVGLLGVNDDDYVYLNHLIGTNDPSELMEHYLKNEKIAKMVDNLRELLRRSIEVRIKRQPKYCKQCIKLVIKGNETIQCKHSKVGILFSGGLDSTIIAAIADEFVPKDESIDLINVAFEKASNKSGNKTEFDVPDRKTGREALGELELMNPTRRWNFVQVNITRKELEECCKRKISSLIHPLKTVLDESLGCAVWFASRGIGLLPSTNELYKSQCRILLLGMGADELFGGYIRHRNIYKRQGWAGLNEELNTELLRISERNLGRDDRVVSDHGVQSRLPYLDEGLIKFVKTLRPWERCCPIDRLPPGVGDKLLLRLLAFKVGLKRTANFPKRAFQFGSRIANSKDNAKSISNLL